MSKKRILLVGGVFDSGVGRRSGYVQKMYDVLIQFYGASYVNYKNGGNYGELVDLVHSDKKWDCIIWMPDVDNGFQKQLPYLNYRMPEALIVQSKYNGGRYTKEQLVERMEHSKAEFLIEFDKHDDRIKARIIDKMGIVRTDTFSVIDLVTDLSLLIYNSFTHQKPIKDGVVPQEYDNGAFGKIRTNHVHEGVDIYAPEGTNVYAMENGVVVGFGQFTGEKVGSGWWNDTNYLMILGASGVINYGEIEINPLIIHIGQAVIGGDHIGNVKQVLKKDKGLPMSMLHIELYDHKTRIPVKEWKLGDKKPENLYDPTKLLLYSGMKYRD